MLVEKGKVVLRIKKVSFQKVFDMKVPLRPTAANFVEKISFLNTLSVVLRSRHFFFFFFNFFAHNLPS